jgi:hypothetical protein
LHQTAADASGRTRIGTASQRVRFAAKKSRPETITSILQRIGRGDNALAAAFGKTDVVYIAEAAYYALFERQGV